MLNGDRMSKNISDILSVKLADLRNSLIHRYWIIDDSELFEQCNADIKDLTDFVSRVNTFTSRENA